MHRLVTISIWVAGGLALIWVLAFSFIAVEALIGVMTSQTIAEITVENRSGEPIVNGEVEFLETTYPFANIGVGESAQISFSVRGEGGYRIRARLASGKEVETAEAIYVTSGWLSDTRFLDTVEVTGDGITLRSQLVEEQAPAPSPN